MKQTKIRLPGFYADYIDVNSNHFAVFSHHLASIAMEGSYEETEFDKDDFLWICREYSELHNAGLCKSPIEEILAARLLFCTNGYGRIKLVMPPEEYDFEGTAFEPQAKFGKYTVDFLITSIHKGTKKQFIVECDGHDYHDRTKEQVSRDKARDRHFMDMGLKTYRFTGSDIFSRLEDVAEEIDNYALHDYESMMIDAGTI